MQNKPNFLNAQMNLTSLITVDYENIANCKLRENKPNTNPINPNFQKCKMNITIYITKDYENKIDLRLCLNKPNQTQLALSLSKGSNLPVVSLPALSLSKGSNLLAPNIMYRRKRYKII